MTSITTPLTLPVVDIGGARIAVIRRPDGNRDLELLTLEDDEPAAVLTLTPFEAEALARLLSDR